MNRKPRKASLEDRMLARLDRRIWPVGISILYVVLGMVFILRWGSTVEHIPKLWISPDDLWISYFHASQVARGHFGAIYGAKSTFGEFPGILVALAPLGALSGALHTAAFEITKNGAVAAPGFSVHPSGVAIPFLNAQEIHFGTTSYVLQPRWVEIVGPYALLLSCAALFACDALAERLQVSKQRRGVLCGAETVLFWNVTVLWGHPEDAVAAALAVYALIFALDGRFVGTGWLFGAALAFQPLVLLMLPVLLAIAGRKHMLGLAVRSAIPAAVLLAVPFMANFRVTLHELADQPSPPSVNHVTPRTALSPKLAGGLVAAGPVRTVGLLLAIGFGFWVHRHWLERPELLAWSCAVALALRSYTESIMTPYYSWAALAVVLAVAARCSRARFGIAVALAVVMTIVAQWRLGWIPWWTVQIVGMTGLLAVASRPEPLPPPKRRAEPAPARTPTGAQARSKADGATKKAAGKPGAKQVARPAAGPKVGRRR